MVKIKTKISVLKYQGVRRHFDEQTGAWYFSIADVMEILTESNDGRNYWKVLKNRLKKSVPELVTKCNQLKMLSRDGKFYLTDTADAQTMLEIIKYVPKVSHVAFEEWLSTLKDRAVPLENEKEEEVEELDEAKLLVDVYQTDKNIFIEAMIAGVSPEDFSIIASSKKINIRGRRDQESFFEEAEESSSKKYQHQELVWTNFSRTISLPSPIQTSNIEKTYERGHLILKLEKV